MESASQPLPPSRNESGCEGVGQIRDPRENGEDSPDSSQTATLVPQSIVKWSGPW
jgi:hypothetical protein